MRQRYILSSIILVGGLLVMAAPAAALDLGGNSFLRQAAGSQGAGFSDTTDEQSFAEMLGTVVRAALTFVGVLTTLLIVYAGSLWMTARGNEDQITKAQNILYGSVIGLALTLGAYALSNFLVRIAIEKAAGG